MEVLAPEGCTPAEGGSVVTIGAYDGVHLGHRHLLAELRRRAADLGVPTTVVTFDRHPATVVRPASAPPLLTDLGQKLELLEDCGIDRTLVVPFDANRADETAEEFVREILVDKVGAKVIVVGEDFHFGHGRKGNVTLLGELGRTLGFEVEGISLRGDEGVAVSSTRIRQLVADGQVAEAGALLGRPHQVRGLVVHGDGRGGSTLGYPTANVEIPREIALPGDGVYAGWYRRPDGTELPAAISVGRRPTFYADDGDLLVEAFVLDFEGDLYGERAQVAFVDRLHGQIRFDSIDELVVQMGRDVDDTRELLTGNG
jgi:riboflavin kinase / FMN adenylyltransferase